jgi:hypothetical protein
MMAAQGQPRKDLIMDANCTRIFRRSCHGSSAVNIGTAAFCMLGLGCLSACQTQPPRPSPPGDELAAAGFKVIPADSATRREMLAHLPPQRFVQRAIGNTMRYFYSDPVVCKCLYIGSQQAYDQFKLREPRMADDQLTMAGELKN